MRISDWSSDVCSSDLAVFRLEPSRDACLGNPALLRGQWWQVMPGLERCSALNSPACFGSHGAKCCALLPSSALGFNERLRQVKGLQGDGQGVLDVRPFDAIGAVKIGADQQAARLRGLGRSEEHTSELQSLMRISYAVFCLKKKKTKNAHTN